MDNIVNMSQQDIVKELTKLQMTMDGIRSDNILKIIEFICRDLGHNPYIVCEHKAEMITYTDIFETEIMSVPLAHIRSLKYTGDKLILIGAIHDKGIYPDVEITLTEMKLVV